jgi:hypothetical protein
MVQIHNLGPSRKSLLQNALGQSLGQGLSNFTNQYFAGKALDDVINNPSYRDSPMGERASRLQRAMMPYGEMGASVLQNRMGIEQQLAQEQEQQVLGKIAQGKDVSEKELARLSPENQFKAIQAKKIKQIGGQIKQSLLNAGYPEETAELWKNQMESAPQGGQTDVIKNVNELLRRSKSGKGMVGEEQKNTLKPSIEIPGIESKSYELDFPELKEPIGKTSADIVKESSENRKINSPLYGSTIDSLNTLDEDFRDIRQLQEYNETPGAIPVGAEKWNVDWNTGDLRVKALATPETQDYVKIIARLLGRAKEYFPGRVTNFDLEQFKQRFPTLANSPEGRKLIAQQLSLANRIAYLKDETLKAAMDHYGAEGDSVQIRKYAQENYRRLKGQLEGELKSLNTQADKKESKQLTTDLIDRYLDMANDDIDKARELARKDGYEF